MKYSALPLILALFAGCASTSQLRTLASPEKAGRGEEVASEEISEEVDEEKPGSEREPTVSSLTLESNERVESWLRYFTTKDRERFQRFLDR